jgi:hypothetical protein
VDQSFKAGPYTGQTSIKQGLEVFARHGREERIQASKQASMVRAVLQTVGYDIYHRQKGYIVLRAREG